MSHTMTMKMTLLQLNLDGKIWGIPTFFCQASISTLFFKYLQVFGNIRSHNLFVTCVSFNATCCHIPEKILLHLCCLYDITRWCWSDYSSLSFSIFPCYWRGEKEQTQPSAIQQRCILNVIHKIRGHFVFQEITIYYFVQ